MNDFPSAARAVIVGGGIVGNSMAYHLARLGWRDLVLIEKGRLPNPGGSTGHASNFIFPVDHSKEMTQLTLESQRQYIEMGVNTECGGIEVARTEERMEELRRRMSSAKAWGIDAEIVSPAFVKEKVPFIEEDQIIGAFWQEGVGVVDSLRAGTLMRERAIEAGALTTVPNVEVLGLDVGHQLHLLFLVRRSYYLGGFLFTRFEAQGLLAGSTVDDFVEPYEGSAADEQDVGGIHRRKFLMWVLASALWRDIGDRAFQDLQKCLLHPFARNITGDGRILVLASDLVDFIDVNDAGLGATYVTLRRLQKLEDDVLNVLTHIACFGKCRGIDDSEGNIEHLRQGLREKSFARAGGSDEQNVRFGKLDSISALPVHINTLVMVINGHRQLLLSLLLSDYVFIKKGLHFLRLGKLVWGLSGGGCSAIILED